MAQARCAYCGRWFKSEPGKGGRQKTCGAEACRRKHKRVLDRQWRAEDLMWVRARQAKVREWAEGREYWKEYRRENPEYEERNRAQTRERMRRRREEERRARAILGDPVGYLRELKARCGQNVCKTGTGGAQVSTGRGITAEDVCKTGTGGGAVVEVVEYLIARELFAKQEGPDSRGGRVIQWR